jgi:hypothetical protein
MKTILKASAVTFTVLTAVYLATAFILADINFLNKEASFAAWWGEAPFGVYVISILNCCNSTELPSNLTAALSLGTHCG